MTPPTTILTCVYCGQAYPEGTPPHGSKVLTDHIAACEKHPMRQVVRDRDKLREALVGLVGCSDKESLSNLRGHMLAAYPNHNPTVQASIMAIDALIATDSDRPATPSLDRHNQTEPGVIPE